MGAWPKNGLGGPVGPFSPAFLPGMAVEVLGLAGPLFLVPGIGLKVLAAGLKAATLMDALGSLAVGSFDVPFGLNGGIGGRLANRLASLLCWVTGLLSPFLSVEEVDGLLLLVAWFRGLKGGIGARGPNFLRPIAIEGLTGGLAWVFAISRPPWWEGMLVTICRFDGLRGLLMWRAWFLSAREATADARRPASSDAATCCLVVGSCLAAVAAGGGGGAVGFVAVVDGAGFLMIGSRSLGNAMGNLNEVLNARRSASLDSFSFFSRSFFFCWSRSFSSETNALNLGATSSGCLLSLEGMRPRGFPGKGWLGRLTAIWDEAGLEGPWAWEIFELSVSLGVFEDLEGGIGLGSA